jgi:hypothetical protein
VQVIVGPSGHAGQLIAGCGLSISQTVDENNKKRTWPSTIARTRVNTSPSGEAAIDQKLGDRTSVHLINAMEVTSL